MTEKIKVENLYKSFGPKKVLNGVSFSLKKGEALVVMGGSGTGKSVLIKNIVGLMVPDSGSIKIDGEEVTSLSREEHNKMLKKIGFLFQGGALFDSLRIWENISFCQLQENIMNVKQAKEHAIQKLASVGLEEYVADLYPAELSGGMQKRAALARAISLDPEILFFDEPTAGLDPVMSSIINNLIAKVSRESGASTITITHDMRTAKTVGDRAALLYEGEFIWCDKVSKLEHSGNEFVDQFINGKLEGPIKVKLQDH